MIRCEKDKKQSSTDATKDSDKHSVIWGMLLSSTLQASVFMEKNYSDNCHSIKNTEDLTKKQMFDISEKLVSEQSDEIYGVKTVNWEDSSWKYLSLIGDEQVSHQSPAHKSSRIVRILRFCIVFWKDEREPSIQYGMGRQIDVVQKFTRKKRLWTELMVSQWNSSGTFSQDSTRCSSATKSKSYC